MVSFADTSHIERIKKLWKEVFGDSDEFLNLYFSEKFQREQCLVCIEEEQVCASLQMLPYVLQLKGISYPACYIFAVMTSSFERNKGYMRQLLEFALDDLKQKKIQLVFLIPQEPYLFSIYTKFGFQKAFLSNKKELVLPQLQTNYFEPDVVTAYEFYAEYYKDKNLVLQSYPQFEFICKTIKIEGGCILAVGANNLIEGLCLCVNSGNGIRALEFLSPDDITAERLLSAIHSRYDTQKAIVSEYKDNVTTGYHLGMCVILDELAFTYADMQSTYLSLMMNE